MKNLAVTLIALMSTLMMGLGQTSSIAVANPNVNGLYATPQIAAKLMRLEFMKLGDYAVYDEFDMAEVYEKDQNFATNCLSKTCLNKLGNELGVDYVASGSFDQLGNKIVISIKIVDVKNNTIYKKAIREFDNQEVELQRMTEILLKEMHGIENNKETEERLQFKNEVITSNNVGKINNSGPRIGYAAMLGNLQEFATRPEGQGGLDIIPYVSMIGYQFEGQYVGTENFSALVEGIVNVSGLEQGHFIPTFSLLNGFRFGKAGWEIAFGPGFGLQRTSKGFFDTEGIFGEKDAYFNESDWFKYAERNYNDQAAHPEFFEDNIFQAPTPEDFSSKYNFDSYHLDTRGSVRVSTQFVFAVGRTFKAGALNIPVNVFYSSRRGGGLVGVNVGFNVIRAKRPINR